MNDNKVYWKQRDGKLISVDDMNINHLRNSLKMLINKIKKHNDEIEKESYWKKQNNKVFLNGDMANEFHESFMSDEDDDRFNEDYGQNPYSI